MAPTIIFPPVSITFMVMGVSPTLSWIGGIVASAGRNSVKYFLKDRL